MTYIILIAAAVIAILALRNIYELYNFNITDYDISTDKIKQNHKYVFLTDLHERSYGIDNELLYQAVVKQNPDAVLIGGDMYISLSKGEIPNEKTLNKISRTTDFIIRLAKEFKVYYAYGNHEVKSFENSYFLNAMNMLKDAGVVFLDDESTSLDDNISLSGLSIDRSLYLKFKNALMPDNYISSKLSARDDNKYNILLAHSPLFFKNYAEYGSDLCLCGHYHGEFLISPQFIPFPKYYAGLFKEKSTDMIVSRGIGSHTINIRILNKPEVVIINLRPE